MPKMMCQLNKILFENYSKQYLILTTILICFCIETTNNVLFCDSNNIQLNNCQTNSECKYNYDDCDCVPHYGLTLKENNFCLYSRNFGRECVHSIQCTKLTSNSICYNINQNQELNNIKTIKMFAKYLLPYNYTVSLKVSSYKGICVCKNGYIFQELNCIKQKNFCEENSVCLKTDQNSYCDTNEMVCKLTDSLKSGQSINHMEEKSKVFLNTISKINKIYPKKNDNQYIFKGYKTNETGGPITTLQMLIGLCLIIGFLFIIRYFRNIVPSNLFKLESHHYRKYLDYRRQNRNQGMAEALPDTSPDNRTVAQSIEPIVNPYVAERERNIDRERYRQYVRQRNEERRRRRSLQMNSGPRLTADRRSFPPIICAEQLSVDIEHDDENDFLSVRNINTVITSPASSLPPYDIVCLTDEANDGQLPSYDEAIAMSFDEELDENIEFVI